MPKYESDHDKQQRHDAAAKTQKDAQHAQDERVKAVKHQAEKENRPAASRDSLHTNPDTASVLDPDEQAQQDAGNKEIQDLRDKHHKEQGGAAHESKAQRLGEKEARFEQRKAEMERKHEETVHPAPQKPGTNPSNITSPATHLDVDTTMGEGEP